MRMRWSEIRRNGTKIAVECARIGTWEAISQVGHAIQSVTIILSRVKMCISSCAPHHGCTSAWVDGDFHGIILLQNHGGRTRPFRSRFSSLPSIVDAAGPTFIHFRFSDFYDWSWLSSEIPNQGHLLIGTSDSLVLYGWVRGGQKIKPITVSFVALSYFVSMTVFIPCVSKLTNLRFPK